jgi:glycosyltransferase involved in cell wall biosynthesis
MVILPNETNDQKKVGDTRLSLYPIDIHLLEMMQNDAGAIAGVPCHLESTAPHPTTIAQYALAQWSRYITTGDEQYLRTFLAQVHWFIEHEMCIDNDASGWAISSPHPDTYKNRPQLSAVTQGCVLSLFRRAYEATGKNEYLEIMQRAVQAFERDILDGGIRTLIGEDGIFFEEVAVYPAAHSLSGCMFALLGLYDYVTLTHDADVEKSLQRCLKTLHALFDEFDSGFWTHTDLLHRKLSSDTQLLLQAKLLEELAAYSGCEHCAMLASRWRNYRLQFGSRLRWKLSTSRDSFLDAIGRRFRAMLFRTSQSSRLLRVCVPVHAFPVTGGTRAVLAGVTQVTADAWHMEYLTQYRGPNPDGMTIHTFGTRMTTPWQFPLVLLYSLAGLWKLISLMRHGGRYDIILPQDGVFTGAFTALAARSAGVRVVCIDHGNLTLLGSQTYFQERIHSLETKDWPRSIRFLARFFIVGYLPALSFLAGISARFVDHYLIPGVVGDGTEEICKRLGIPISRVTRFGSMIDTSRYTPLDGRAKTDMRAKYRIPADAIVIAMTCRLAPEKGIDIALKALGRVASVLTPDRWARVRVVIAGDGPLRTHVEKMIRLYGLSETCIIWGETATAGVISLLGMSDVFLYTSIRGACFSMSVLEAMACGCAVIASTRPLSNEHLLAEGRGIAIPAENVVETARALSRLLNDVELCYKMGQLARDYAIANHGPTIFKQVLMRATYYSPELLDCRAESEK